MWVIIEFWKSKEVLYNAPVLINSSQGASEFVTCDARRKDSDRRKDFHRGLYNLRYNTSLLRFKVELFFSNSKEYIQYINITSCIGGTMYGRLSPTPPEHVNIVTVKRPFLSSKTWPCQKVKREFPLVVENIYTTYKWPKNARQASSFPFQTTNMVSMCSTLLADSSQKSQSIISTGSLPQ